MTREEDQAGSRAGPAPGYAVLASLTRDVVLLIRREDGRILEANAAAEAHYGYTRAELLGLTIADLRAPSSVHLTAREMAAADEGGLLFETVHRRKDGSTFDVEVSSRGDTLDGVRVLVSVVRDVTARKRAEEALRQADRRKSEFLAVLSHELRNPLAPIRNALGLLDAEDPAVAARARAVLQRQVDQLTRLVDDLLDLSRIEHGKIELRRACLDAREVLRRAYQDAWALFDARGVTLDLSLPQEPLWVAADDARLLQMIGNLLHNALKFTPAGGTVQLGARPSGDACEVSVRDSGAGLDPKDLARIFEPFVQSAAPAGGNGGLGLGLALVRELARKHGGSVRAASAGHGHGAEFVLALPRSPPPRVAPAAAAPRPVPARGLSILIVEDHEDAGATLADLLALGGHEVRLATTAEAGLRAMQAALPDVLVCDLGLPDRPGLEVIRAARTLPGGAGFFAIALTGYALSSDREAALAAGFDAHLAKPPDLDRLEAFLAEVARRR